MRKEQHQEGCSGECEGEELGVEGRPANDEADSLELQSDDLQPEPPSAG